jgi:primosomal protein N' (replication factor Y)
MTRLWQAVLLSAPYPTLTYEMPARLPEPVPGLRVVLPLRGSLRVGVLLAPCARPPEGVALKPVLWPLEVSPVLDAAHLALARELALHQMVALGRVLESILPFGLRTARIFFAIELPGLPARLTPRAIQRLPGPDLDRLAAAFARGEMRVVAGPAGGAEARVAVLTRDPPWGVRPNAVRKLAVLETLFERGPQSLTALTRGLGTWAVPTARGLVRDGLVRIGWQDEDEAAGPAAADREAQAPFTPTREQQAALTVLRRSLAGREFGTGLVHGVTGSGKTHIYLSLAEACLALGRSALLLAPEVALARRLFREAKSRLPHLSVQLHHGSQSPARREAAFLRLARDPAPALVVGTRSALFLPIRDLGLIVLDEEHDESFKQDERLPYHAREVAYFRARQSGGLLVLGSATPDVKTFHAAREKRLPLVRLSQRVGSGRLPGVRLVDIKDLRDPDQPLAEESLAALQATLVAGDQAMIMQNRRGFSPLMYCLDCGRTIRCPDCHVGLTFHKDRERLLCHYCGLSLRYPLLCEECGGANFLPLGRGTQRVEEVLRKTLPRPVGILRLDRDSARRAERLDEILDNFESGAAQVLVGTQMLSKGHHFPQVTLVVVADGDLGLNLPDYRAAERTFQLLVQVSGRAGRGEKPGQVLIQTRNPGHRFWRHVVAGDYEAFFAEEIRLREKFRYPPFVRLGLVRLSFPADWPGGTDCLAAFAKALRGQAGPLGIVALGPAPAPLSRLRGNKRYHSLLKCADWAPIRSLFAKLSALNPAPGMAALTLDLDPVSML